MDKNNLCAYAYVKGEKYETYSFTFDGNEDINEVGKTFEEKADFIDFIIRFSNYYSIPVQFYI